MKKILIVVAFITIVSSLLSKTWAQSNQIVDGGSATTIVTFPKTGCVYNWVNNNPNIGLATSGTGDIPSFIAVNTGNIVISANILVTPESSCTPISFTITVRPKPALIVSGILAALNNTYGTASTSTQFNLAAANIQSEIIITPPPGFEISTDNINFSDTVNIAGELSNANLNLIKLTPDLVRTLIPGSSDYNYSAAVADITNTIQVTPIAININANIKINGLAVKSNAISPPIALVVGDNTINIVVTAHDGVTTKTYTIIVNRAPSTDASLEDLKLSQGVLSPVFTANTTTYIAKVNSDVSLITLTPTLTNANASIKVNSVIMERGLTSAIILLHTGSNVIQVDVTAQDGITMKNYTLIVVKAESNNADISQIFLTPTSTLISASGTNKFTTSVSPTLKSVQQTIIVTDPNATIKVNGIQTASGVAFYVALNNTGTTIINTVITAQDGITTKTYSITISKTGNADTEITQWGITPTCTTTYKSASGTTFFYTTSVKSSVTSIQQKIVTDDPNATIKINGTTVISGTFSNPIALNNNGTTTITNVITAQDGITNRTYVLTVSRNGSSNTNLSQLSLSPASTLTLVPKSGLINYTTSVDPSVNSVQQLAVTSDPGAKIKVNGIAVASGTLSAPISLNSSGTTTITTLITAEDGVSTYTTNIIISKNGSTNAKLSQIILTPASTLTSAPSVGSINYTTSVSPLITSIRQIAVPIDVGATIKVNGVIVASGAASALIPLNNSGTTIITTIVTAQDGITTQVYTIVISKNGSTNTAISGLTLTPATTLTQTPGTNNYTTSVSPSISNIQLTITGSDANAIIKVNGVLVASGEFSDAIMLNTVGTTNITAIITAQDGISSQVYNIKVNKNGSSNAALSQLYLSPSSPALTFKNIAGTTNYTTSLSPTITTVTQTAIASDAGATVKVNGIIVPSGMASNPISINNTGPTIITTTVTAKDGTTIKTYTITINQGSNNEILASLPTTALSATMYVRLTATAPAGLYAGNVVLSSKGITETYVPTALSKVNKAPLTISVNNVSKTFGTTLTPIINTTEFTAIGLKNGQLLNTVDIDYGNGALASASVGTYYNSVIPLAAIGDKGFLSSNYTINYVAKDIIVTPAPLTVTIKNVTKNYGTVIANTKSVTDYTTLTGTLQNGNTINVISVMYGTGAAATASGGVHIGSVVPFGATGGNGFESNNYDITYIPANIIVLPIKLTIKADNQVKDFAKDNPPLTIKYSGFANNDDTAQLDSQPVASTLAGLRAAIGQYPINVSGGASLNYVFNYEPGILTVNSGHIVLLIPNVITPNSDGINDTWNVKNLDAYPNASVDVYDRYGRKVFSTIGYGTQWDGTFRGTNLPTGAYYYIINPKLNTRILQGNVNIVR
jgi:gliding motility-associated-like protein